MTTFFQDVPMGGVFTYGNILYRRKCVNWAEPVAGGDEKWFPNCEFVKPSTADSTAKPGPTAPIDAPQSVEPLEA